MRLASSRGATARCPRALVLLCLFLLLVALLYVFRLAGECTCPCNPISVYEGEDDVFETAPREQPQQRDDGQPESREQIQKPHEGEDDGQPEPREQTQRHYKGENQPVAVDWPYVKADLPLAFELSTKSDRLHLQHAFEAQKQLVYKYLESLWGEHVGSDTVTFPYWFRQEFLGHYPLDIVRAHTTVGHTNRSIEILIERKSPEEVVLRSNWNAQQPPIVMIMAYKNEPDSLKRFLERIAEAVNTTKETALRVLIIDFESKVDPATVAAPIPIECRVIQHGSKTFSRAGGLERGVHAVKNDNDIIFAVDVDMYLPLDFMKRIRNRVAQGRRVFCPVCQRATWEKIQQGKVSDSWFPAGLGMFGAFKSDFVQVGSYDPKEFTHWGGEDVDLAKKFFFHHFMIVRTKEPDYYHVDHCARGRDGWGGHGLDC